MQRAVEKIVLDTRTRPIRVAFKGNGWNWFSDRNITIEQMTESKSPESIFTIRVFPSLGVLYAHLDAIGVARQTVVYVSDDEDALRRAHETGLLTLALPPAPATNFTTAASTTFPDTDMLSRLINQIEWRQKDK